MDEAGVFHKIPRLDDAWLVEVLTREVLAFLIGRELLSPEWAERILSWRHMGFNVYAEKPPPPSLGTGRLDGGRTAGGVFLGTYDGHGGHFFVLDISGARNIIIQDEEGRF